MWRRRVYCLLSRRPFSSEPDTQSLYSFLRPSIFSLNKSNPIHLDKPQEPILQKLTPDLKSSLESNLQLSLLNQNTDEAWKSFKTLTNCSSFPSKTLTNSLIIHLSSLNDAHNLKRAFASVVYVLGKDPKVIKYETLTTLLISMKNAKTVAPAFALVKCMFKNRYFVPFELWGCILVDISRESRSLAVFHNIFMEICRMAIEEKLDFLKPDLSACNAALEGCCYELESVLNAEKVVDIMSELGIWPNESTFGLLGYLYAVKGLKDKILELETTMSKFIISEKVCFQSNLVRGYVKCGNLDSVSQTILGSLQEGKTLTFPEETYSQVVKGFLENGGVKHVAGLIIEAQKLESSSIEVEKSLGFGIVSACVNNGLLDKAHSILDEMNAQGASIGLGVYVSILKAYCKDQRTAEAAQLVADINNQGLQLDAGSYDTLIDTSMSCQDFQSAFSLFRDMREARHRDLKSSYLTIMTGLTESHRPELMAAFLDEVVEDPRIEVGTHDWNSIIHAFCKAGRLEDARRTFRRMVFLRFEPNEQTYLSLINGFTSAEKYFSVLMLWHDVKKKISMEEEEKRLKLSTSLVDAFLYSLVKGGFFDAVMQVVDKSQEMKIFVDKWRYKQAFMEKHKKLKVSKLRRKNFKKMEALVAFKNWAGLNV